MLERVSSATLPFQFTPLREGRPEHGGGKIKRGDFNSRPSARGDPTQLPRDADARNFNSRPSARGDPEIWWA